MTKILLPFDSFDNSVPAVRTMVFVVDGVAYELDLGEANAIMADEDFGKYIRVADRLGPAQVKVGNDIIVKAKPKTTKPKTTQPTQAEPPLVPSEDTPHADPPAGQGEAPNDGLPPDKSWLQYKAGQKRYGPGFREREQLGVGYRNNMRTWLRANGYPHLGIRGSIPHEAIDKYWEHIQGIRAGTKNPR